MNKIEKEMKKAKKDFEEDRELHQRIKESSENTICMIDQILHSEADLREIVVRNV